MARPTGSFDPAGRKVGSGAPKGNTSGETIGHRGARNALQRGEPFRGLALVKEQEVSAELEMEGVEALLIRDAIRLQTVTDLYYDAILCAEQQGRIQTLDNYLARHASLTTRAMTAWEQVRQLQRERETGVLDYEQVLERDRD